MIEMKTDPEKQNYVRVTIRGKDVWLTMEEVKQLHDFSGVILANPHPTLTTEQMMLYRLFEGHTVTSRWSSKHWNSSNVPKVMQLVAPSHQPRAVV